MSRFVISAFKPKAGMQQRLLAVVKKHRRVLHEQGLITDRPRYAMQAADGTMVEVFEWRSREAIEQAHHNPVVLALWAEYEAASEHVPMAALPESQRLFSEFEALPAGFE